MARDRPAIGVRDAQNKRKHEPQPAVIALKEHSMLDVIMLALGLGFFMLSIGYAYACDRL
jgi:hypothetical protein